MVYKFEEVQKVLEDNGITFSQPRTNEETGGASVYPRAGRNRKQPRFLLPVDLNMPFEISAGRGKEIDLSNPNMTYNMELSLDQSVAEHQPVISFFKELDSLYQETIKTNSKEIYRKQLSANELQFKQRPSLIQSSKNENLYLLRVKVRARQTRVYVVTGEDSSNNTTNYREGNLSDLRPGSRIVAQLKYVMGYASASLYGSMYFGEKLLVYPYNKSGNNGDDDNDDDIFPFGGNTTFKLESSESTNSSTVPSIQSQKKRKRPEPIVVNPTQADSDGDLSSLESQ